jgi:hypothetical protein
MKRGLVMAADGDAAVYEARLERLRDMLRESGARVGLIYGDVHRSDDIAHLVNLCIYWNEGVLAVPADRPPALLAKLSARVHPWMRRTSVLADLRASHQLPDLIAQYIGEQGPGAVAFVDLSWWPADLAGDVRDALGDRTVLDLPDAVRSSRLTPDAHDRSDLQRAGAIVAEALGAARSFPGDARSEQRIAAIERSARGAGARDVIASCRTLTAGSTQLELTVQFANVWASAGRVLPAAPQAEAALRQLAASLTPGATVSGLRRLHTGAALVHHCDLATAGEYRTSRDDASALPEGAVVRLAVQEEEGLVADTYLLDGEGASLLTGSMAEVIA